MCQTSLLVYALNAFVMRVNRTFPQPLGHARARPAANVACQALKGVGNLVELFARKGIKPWLGTVVMCQVLLKTVVADGCVHHHCVACGHILHQCH